jgi:pimeloyl-ACP methyl ester carboxylesterase
MVHSSAKGVLVGFWARDTKFDDFAKLSHAGVPEYRAGPYFSHTDGYSPLHITRAVEYLQDVLDEEGPFDGIFGFSQGAALTLSYFYQQQAAGEPIAVKFACFFSAALPCSPDADMGLEVVSKLQALEYDITDRARREGKGLTMEEQEFVDVLQGTVVDASANDPTFPWTDMDVYRYGECDAVPRVMCSSLVAQKIRIPTVHAWGQNDFEYMIKMAEVARSICDDSMLKTVLHTGLHDIPKRQTEIKGVLRAIDWAMTQA